MDAETPDAAAELSRLSEAIERDPSDPVARTERGDWYLRRGRTADALQDLDVAVALAPSEAPPLVQRAMVWMALSESDGTSSEFLTVEALADLDRSLALEPESGEACGVRGIVLRGLGCADEAVTDLRGALDLGAPPAPFGLWLAAAALDADDPETALAAVEAVEALGGELTEVLRWKGSALHALHRGSEALAVFDAAVRQEPENPQFRFLRARSRREAGDAAGAVEDLSHAIALKPTREHYFRERAEARSLLGDERGADADWGRSMLLGMGESTEDETMAKRKLIYLRLREHFGDVELEDLRVHERRFPRRVRADVQRALDALAESRFSALDFTGLESEHGGFGGMGFSQLAKRRRHSPVVATAPQYEDVDIGTDAPVRCLVSGLWLLDVDGTHIACLLSPPSQHGPGGQHFQVAVPEGATALADELFALLEDAVAEARCYRGKVLSLETCHSDYTGRSSGIAVHRLPRVTRGDVILPEATLELLERNVFEFIERRPRLRDLRMSTKKGVLFYGPPGTGKTHTIRYLASTLVGQTTLLITADQIGLLDEYMILARLLQPAIVVIEDVDLIARDREHHEHPGTESLLNRLLNEMDGLRPDVEVLFVLTTNRPEHLEQALASRPGRIDQAIEFPRPDDACRRRLAALYSGGLVLSDAAMDTVVQRTEGASASFVRELMRRAAQFMLSRGVERDVEPRDVEAAIREMIEVGGTLNRSLLGA